MKERGVEVKSGTSTALSYSTRSPASYHVDRSTTAKGDEGGGGVGESGSDDEDDDEEEENEEEEEEEEDGEEEGEHDDKAEEGEDEGRSASKRGGEGLSTEFTEGPVEADSEERPLDRGGAFLEVSE
jgi:hypothetical protein